jgi:hypothetical protein
MATLGQRLVAQRGVLLKLVEQAKIGAIKRYLFHKTIDYEIKFNYSSLMKFYCVSYDILIG